jgi:glycosyltransferase involved in cell wall biosynthesis
MDNILLISDVDTLALNINSNLRERGYSSTLLTTKTVPGAEGVVNVSDLTSRRLLWLKNAVRSFISRRLVFWTGESTYFQDISERSDYFDLARIRRKVPGKPDVIIILFDYRIVTTKTVADLYHWSGATIVWMLVDMKPMTGGCAYSGACNGYQVECSDCPLIGNPLLKGIPSLVLRQKRRNLDGVRLHLIAGSTMQADQARSSWVFRDRPIRQLFFPVDETIFKCGDKARAKRAFGLSEKDQVILFGATKLGEARKGFSYLIDALRLLTSRVDIANVLLLIVGSESLSGIEILGYRFKQLGFVSYGDLARAYQAADVFVCPSIEDSGPVMVNQAIMCGAPVVAFKMGVSLDLVRDGGTGVLANMRDVEGLCEGIRKILTLPEDERMAMTERCHELSKQLGYAAFCQALENLLADGNRPQQRTS